MGPPAAGQNPSPPWEIVERVRGSFELVTDYEREYGDGYSGIFELRGTFALEPAAAPLTWEGTGQATIGGTIRIDLEDGDYLVGTAATVDRPRIRLTVDPQAGTHSVEFLSQFKCSGEGFGGLGGQSNSVRSTDMYSYPILPPQGSLSPVATPVDAEARAHWPNWRESIDAQWALRPSTSPVSIEATLLDHVVQQRRNVYTPLHSLSAAAHSYFDGNTRIHGDLTIRGPRGERVEEVELEVLQGGSVVARAQLAGGVRDRLIRAIPASGRLTVRRSPEPLFELPSSQAALVNSREDGRVSLRAVVRTESTPEQTDDCGQAEILARYTGTNRYPTRDRDLAVGGDDWVRPSVARLATHYGDVLFGDFSNMNGGPFPPHKEHQFGTDVDAWITGYDARDAAVAERLIAQLNDPSYGRSITAVGVTFTPAFRRAIQDVRLDDGRAATGVFQNWKRHHDHFHWRVAAPVPRPRPPRRPGPVREQPQHAAGIAAVGAAGARGPGCAPADPTLAVAQEVERVSRGEPTAATTRPRRVSGPSEPVGPPVELAAAAPAPPTAAEPPRKHRDWTGTVFAIASEDPTALHFLADCPALRQALHPVDEFSAGTDEGPVAAAVARGEPPCGTCLRMLDVPMPAHAITDDCLWWGESHTEQLAILRDRIEHVQAPTWLAPERVGVYTWDEVVSVDRKGPHVFSEARVVIATTRDRIDIPFDDESERDELYEIAARRFEETLA